MRKLSCLRCDTPMEYILTENLQLGKTSWVMGDIPNLLAGALLVEVYICPQCGKIEFYRGPEEAVTSEATLPQKTCPRCGMLHDFDMPKCPYCKYDYYSR